MDKEKKFISAVVYVYNAEAQIYSLLNDLFKCLEQNFEHAEIICVNDHSTDNSVQEIKRGGWEFAGTVALSVVNMSSFHGLEIAMNAGVDLSIGDFVLEIDNTVQDYSMEEIINVYRKVLEGYDIVSASPDGKQKFTSTLFYQIYEKFSDNHVKMHTETFRILSRRAINRVGAMSKMVPYRKGLYVNCGLKIFNMQYHSLNVPNADNDQKVKKFRRELAVDALIMFTNAGYICAKTMTVAMMLLSFLMAVYTIIIYLKSDPVTGWTTTILFLAAAFCGLFAILTIIIKYLQILLNLTFKRGKYNFESVEKLTK